MSYENAECVGQDPELWFPVSPAARTGRSREDYRFQIAYAKSFCDRCPARQRCLDDHVYDEHGIFGALDPDERRRYRAKMGIQRTADSYNSLSWVYSTTQTAINTRRRRRDSANASAMSELSA